MADKDKKSGFPRDSDGDVACGALAGQERKACDAVQKKEAIDKMPRDDDGNLDCHKMTGEERTLCVKQKTAETAKKSVGMRNE